MARIVDASITYGRKISLGDYNNAHIEISLGVEFDEDDDVDIELAKLWQHAKTQVKAQALPLIRKQQAQVEDVYNGLPAEVQEQLSGGV